MVEMEEMVQKGTEGNQAKWDLKDLLEKKVKWNKQDAPFSRQRINELSLKTVFNGN